MNIHASITVIFRRSLEDLLDSMARHRRVSTEQTLAVGESGCRQLAKSAFQVFQKTALQGLQKHHLSGAVITGHASIDFESVFRYLQKAFTPRGGHWGKMK